jgi:hypothetical protein
MYELKKIPKFFLDRYFGQILRMFDTRRWIDLCGTPRARAATIALLLIFASSWSAFTAHVQNYRPKNTCVIIYSRDGGMTPRGGAL